MICRPRLESCCESHGGPSQQCVGCVENMRGRDNVLQTQCKAYMGICLIRRPLTCLVPGGESMQLVCDAQCRQYQENATKPTQFPLSSLQSCSQLGHVSGYGKPTQEQQARYQSVELVSAQVGTWPSKQLLQKHRELSPVMKVCHRQMFSPVSKNEPGQQALNSQHSRMQSWVVLCLARQGHHLQIRLLKQ